MQILNLRELYPDVYKTDVYLNVSDEVYAVFPTYKRAEAAYQRQVYRYKAQYSLDCDNGIENAVLQRLPTPEEVFEKKQLYAQIYAAMIDLPGKQAERIFACFFLDLTPMEISRIEGVHVCRIHCSIRKGLKRLQKQISQIIL